MKMTNPFVAQMDLHGWKLAGDRWARVALQARERARECWAKARVCADQAEQAAKDLAREAHCEREAERALWAVEAPADGD
jgi:hypothetical protein